VLSCQLWCLEWHKFENWDIWTSKGHILFSNKQWVSYIFVMQLPCHMYFKWLKCHMYFRSTCILHLEVYVPLTLTKQAQRKKMLHSLFFQSNFISIHCTLIRLVTLHDSLQSGTGQYTYHDSIQPGITQFIAQIQGMKPYAPVKDKCHIYFR
jgi:hypothetical protein